MGTAALVVALAGWTLFDLESPGAYWRLVGSALYLLGTFSVTLVFNVPLNNRLAKVPPGSPEADELWRHYLKAWTAWNTVRTVAPAAALGALILGMCA